MAAGRRIWRQEDDSDVKTGHSGVKTAHPQVKDDDSDVKTGHSGVKKNRPGARPGPVPNFVPSVKD